VARDDGILRRPVACAGTATRVGGVVGNMAAFAVRLRAWLDLSGGTPSKRRQPWQTTVQGCSMGDVLDLAHTAVTDAGLGPPCIRDQLKELYLNETAGEQPRDHCECRGRAHMKRMPEWRQARAYDKGRRDVGPTFKPTGLRPLPLAAPRQAHRRPPLGGG